MLHVMHVLTVLYAHHSGAKLYALDVHHRALDYLRNRYPGVTQPHFYRDYLHYMVAHRIAPRYW